MNVFSRLIIVLGLAAAILFFKVTFSPPSNRQPSRRLLPPRFVFEQPKINLPDIEVEKKSPPAPKTLPLEKTETVKLPAAQVSHQSNADFFTPSAAAEALIADLNSGETVYEFKSNFRWPTASLSKLMSAVILFKNAKDDDIITIPAGAFSLSRSGAERYPLEEGNRYRAADLARLMLLPSSNQAAEAAAAALGREKFVAEMNSQAKLWGMNDTNFDEPTGLSISNQSTARDLGLMVASIYKEYPKILELTQPVKSPVLELNENRRYEIASLHQFAGTLGFLGGKTGYTDEAGGNLISLIKFRSRPVLFIVLGTTDRFVQTQKLIRYYRSKLPLGG